MSDICNGTMRSGGLDGVTRSDRGGGGGLHTDPALPVLWLWTKLQEVNTTNPLTPGDYHTRGLKSKSTHHCCQYIMAIEVKLLQLTNSSINQFFRSLSSNPTQFGSVFLSAHYPGSEFESLSLSLSLAGSSGTPSCSRAPAGRT